MGTLNSLFDHGVGVQNLGEIDFVRADLVCGQLDACLTIYF